MFVSGTALKKWILTPDPSAVSEMGHQVTGIFILMREVMWQKACLNQWQCHVCNVLPPAVALNF
jgi:hypothetical protein